VSHKLQAGDRLVVASHNKGKVWEIKQLLQPYGLDAVSASELDLAEPEETETTFKGNARLKAVAAATASGLPALADDSGLEVDILDGAPGIYSARWAGAAKDFSFAMKRVAEEIAAKGGWDAAVKAPPRANFMCALCLAWPDGTTEIYTGQVFGHLVTPPRGGNGFGYDPMFVADKHDVTFGEMEPQAKYAISHRTRAFAAFKATALDHLPRRSEPDGDEKGATLEGLTAAAANLSTKPELVQFLEALRADLKDHPDDWTGVELQSFLEALQGWLNDSNNLDDEPKWRLIAKSLLGASRYE
jgi:XTP/dITP diphosphohydrolase